MTDLHHARIASKLLTGAKDAEPMSKPIINLRGEFITVLQGDQLILLSRKDVRNSIELLKNFAQNGGADEE